MQTVAFQVPVKLREEALRGDGIEAEMSEQQEILDYLVEVVGEEGCGISCIAADVFKDEDGWKLIMEGFMEPWKIGKNVHEAKETLKELSSMSFGLV